VSAGIRTALEQLLGAQPDRVTELARLASPVSHVDRNDPPLFLLHGDQDPQMPVNQALEMQGAYERLGLDVQLDVLHGAAHGGEQANPGLPIFDSQLAATLGVNRHAVWKLVSFAGACSETPAAI
jgi:acetyl esterase/lipase